jgi:uncharacterized BrkB/YihY/UPF0761 family membrane protein
LLALAFVIILPLIKEIKMQVKDIVDAIGDFFEWTFEILPVLGNIPNLIFLILGFLFFFYWMGQMRKHKRAGEH